MNIPKLPHDLTLEKNIIATCFHNQVLLPFLKQEYFYSNIHKSMYASIEAGHFYLSESVAAEYDFSFPQFMEVLEHDSILNESHYHKLEELYFRRKTILEYFQHIQRYSDLSAVIPELESTKESELQQIHEAWKAAEPININGYPILSELIGGVNLGDVWVLAGRSTVGKTGLGYQILRGICEGHNEKGMFISLEMSKDTLLQRVASIDYYQKYPGATEKENKDWFFENKDDIDFARRYLRDDILLKSPAGATLADIERLVRIEQANNPDLNTIVIDYLQLIQGDKKQDRRNEVASIARSLKQLAKRLKIRIIVLCQTKRPGPNKKGICEPVTMEDLKESGDIEEGADLITGSWRPFDYPDKAICMEVLKSRNYGATGVRLLGADGTYFYNLTKEEAERIEWDINNGK